MAIVEVFERVGQRLGPHLVITAGVHGDEYEGIEAVRLLMSEIEASNLSGRVTLIPIANESAYSLGARTGIDGLDLARTFPGRSDGSITQQVAHDLSRLIRSADLYVDLHSGGKAMRIEPLVGYMLVTTAEVLEQQRKMARAFGLPIIWGTSSKLEGRSLSVARDAGIPAIYAEYLGGGECSPEGVSSYFEGCLSVMSSSGMISASGKVAGEVELAIEDPRPSSGHLQVCHPSAVAGAFVPTVRLGQTLGEGTVFGHVMAAGDRSSHPVVTDRSGRLICLRFDPEVEKGDSLAVILETDPKMSNV